MESRPVTGLAQHYAAALDWWREAGVDMDFLNEPQAMLAEPEAAAPPLPVAERKPVAPPPAPVPTIGGDRVKWPSTLENFSQWWLTEPSLADAGTRLAPRGSAKPQLMILVPMPEAGDSDTLLGSAQGMLVASMLRAMQISADDAYIASAIPVHQPLSDWDALQSAGLGDVLAHHIGLVAPRRLLVLGNDLLPLLGLEKRQGVRELVLNGMRVELLASFAPDNLLANAKARANLWRRWLEWTQDA